MERDYNYRRELEVSITTLVNMLDKLGAVQIDQQEAFRLIDLMQDLLAKMSSKTEETYT